MKILVESSECAYAIRRYVCEKYKLTLDDVGAVQGIAKQSGENTLTIECSVEVKDVPERLRKEPYR